MFKFHYKFIKIKHELLEFHININSTWHIPEQVLDTIQILFRPMDSGFMDSGFHFTYL